MSSDPSQTQASTCAPGTLEEELEQIEREQSEAVDLEDKERELRDLNQRARHLSNELRATRTARRQRSAEAALPVIHPREPCVLGWADMVGGERVRQCGKCKAKVYDLGGLDPVDARRLLSDREGRLPGHVFGRVDGTVTVDGCKEKRRRLSPIAAGIGVASAVALLGSGTMLGLAMASPDDALYDELDDLSSEIARLESRQTRAVEAVTPTPPPATSATQTPPPRETTPAPKANDDDRRRRHHRRPRCRKRSRLGYDSWTGSLFYFADPDDCG